MAARIPEGTFAPLGTPSRSSSGGEPTVGSRTPDRQSVNPGRTARQRERVSIERWRRLAAAGAAGLTLHLAYPRPDWDLVGWICLAPVLALAVTAESPWQAMAEGWVAGLAFFLALLRWLTHTMTTYSTLSPLLAVGVLLALSAYLALYWGLVSGALAWVRGPLGGHALWLAPAFWVAAELARTYVLSGFPWGLVGYVPYRRLALIQIAAWTGVYGVSALLVTVNAAIAWAALERRRVAVVAGGLVCTLAVGGALVVGGMHLVGPPADTLAIAVVQGDIDQAVKWDKAFKDQTLRIYTDLTREAAPGMRLLVWPEAAVPAYVRDEPQVFRSLTELSAQVMTPLLVGAPDVRVEDGVARYLNSAFLFQAGDLGGRYDKIHLVPFGEYVPLKGLLFFVHAVAAGIGDFTPGRTPVVFPLQGAPFGTVVCYEVIFPDLFRQFVARGATFMVNITNDAWFGDSGGPLQHLATVPLRAVENGVAVARAANTGVSAFVAPSGAIEAELGLGRRGFLQGEVTLRRGETFYTRFGDVFAYAMSALSLAALTVPLAAGRRA